MSPPARAMVIEEFTPVVRNTLRGFARVRLPSATIFHDVSIHQKGETAWASPASKAMIGKDGAAMRDANGKLQYSPVISFASREVRDRFSKAVVDAIRLHRPEALDGR